MPALGALPLGRRTHPSFAPRSGALALFLRLIAAPDWNFVGFEAQRPVPVRQRTSGRLMTEGCACIQRKGRGVVHHAGPRCLSSSLRHMVPARLITRWCPKSLSQSAAKSAGTPDF